MNDDVDDVHEHARSTAFPRWPVLLAVVGAAGITAAAMSATTRPARLGARPAAMSGAPAIVWRTPLAHEDRGACTDCHRVVSREGERLPTITALSSMPHAFRGVCNNCHALHVSWLLAVLPASAMPNPAGPTTGLGSLVGRVLALGADGE